MLSIVSLLLSSDSFAIVSLCEQLHFAAAVCLLSFISFTVIVIELSVVLVGAGFPFRSWSLNSCCSLVHVPLVCLLSNPFLFSCQLFSWACFPLAFSQFRCVHFMLLLEGKKIIMNYWVSLVMLQKMKSKKLISRSDFLFLSCFAFVVLLPARLSHPLHSHHSCSSAPLPFLCFFFFFISLSASEEISS